MALGGGSHREAFTLIEMLAVVVIMTLAAGVFLQAMSTAPADVRVREAAHQWQSIDARARLASRTEGSIDIRIRQGGDQVVALGAVAGEVILSQSLPATCTIVVDGEPVSSVRIDALGRSPNYRITVSHAEQALALSVNGISGWAESVEGQVP